MAVKKTVAEAIAEACYKAGAKVVTCVPGHGCNEVFADLEKISGQVYPVSFHEEVAYTIAHSAAICGTRAVAVMKSHGILKAGNSVSDSLYAGITAGCIVLVVTDKTGRQSDSILDILPYLKGIGLPYVIGEGASIGRQIIYLFETSEKQGLPQAMVIDAEDVSRVIIPDKLPYRKSNIPLYERDIASRVLCPSFTEFQSDVLQYKQRNGDWKTIAAPVINDLDDVLPEKWQPAIELYKPLFTKFRSYRGEIVTGDTGLTTLFALKPFNCIDITTYMGGSIPIAIGAYLSGYRDVWAVTGDFSFIAAGHLGLPECRQRQIPLKIIILYNGKAETTGGQVIPDGMLETVLGGYKENISFIDNPQDPSGIEKVLAATARARDLKIVIADYRETGVRSCFTD